MKYHADGSATYSPLEVETARHSAAVLAWLANFITDAEAMAVLEVADRDRLVSIVVEHVSSAAAAIRQYLTLRHQAAAN